MNYVLFVVGLSSMNCVLLVVGLSSMNYVLFVVGLSSMDFCLLVRFFHELFTVLSVFHELCTIRSPSASLLIRLPLKNILVVRLL
jgi:hypothetical protein